MKKLFIIIILFFVGISTGFALSGKFFADVSDDEWFSPYVNDMYEEGIIQGKADGLFHPSDTVMRSELSKIMSKYISTLDQKYAKKEECLGEDEIRNIISEYNIVETSAVEKNEEEVDNSCVLVGVKGETLACGGIKIWIKNIEMIANGSSIRDDVNNEIYLLDVYIENENYGDILLFKTADLYFIDAGGASYKYFDIKDYAKVVSSIKIRKGDRELISLHFELPRSKNINLYYDKIKEGRFELKIK